MKLTNSFWLACWFTAMTVLNFAIDTNLGRWVSVLNLPCALFYLWKYTIEDEGTNDC